MLKTSLLKSPIRTAATLLLATVVWGVSVSASQATRITFDATLNGASEVPPNASTATGLAKLILDTNNNTVDVYLAVTEIKIADITFDPTGPVSVLAFGNLGPFHVHLGGPSDLGSIVVPFGNLAYYADTAEGFSMNVKGVSIASDLVSDFIAENVYFNLHTTRGTNLEFAGGEIRGQLARVPEPGSALIFGAGLLALGRLRRRR